MVQEKTQSFKKVFLMWSIILFGYFLSIFHSLTTAILQPYLMEEFSLDNEAVTNIGSMFFYAYLCMQIPTGLLADKFGAKFTALAGLSIATLGAFCFASATSPFLLYFGRAFIGLGISTIFVCVLKFQVAFMPTHIITSMTGLACFVGALGGIVAQSPLAFLVESFGWRTTIYGIGFITLINAILVLFFVKNTPPLKANISLEHNDKAENNIFKALFSILFDWRSWPPIMVHAIFYGSYVVLMGYSGTPWIEHTYNLSVLQASSTLIIAVIGCALASVLIGLWSDRIHNRRFPMLFSGLCYTLCWASLAYFSEYFSLTFISILLFLIGFFSCAYVISFSCVQEINPQKFSGIAGAVVNMGGYMGPIFVPMLFVHIQNSYENPISSIAFTHGFKYVFYVVAFCFIFSFLTREPNKEAKK